MVSHPSESIVESAPDDTAAATRLEEPSGKRRHRLQIPAQALPGTLLLLQAYEYAVDVDHDLWDFAVELTELRRVGLTKTDCRWLICKGWAELARELAPRPGGSRRFRREMGLAFSNRDCLVLSSKGVNVVRRQVRQRGTQLLGSDAALRATWTSRPAPRWDRHRRQLRVGGKLTKQFKLPSPNQERVLMAFEEESWPPRIDDPLPPSKKIDAKQRLHDTIKNLNRNQKHRLIRFMGDGTGQGVRWEFEEEAVAAAEAMPRHPK